MKKSFLAIRGLVRAVIPEMKTVQFDPSRKLAEQEREMVDILANVLFGKE